MSETISDEALNKLIGESFGFEIESVGGKLRYHNKALDAERGGIWNSPLPDYVTDPAMTVMLMEKLRNKGMVFVCGSNGWGVRVVHVDENYIQIEYTRPSDNNSETVGRAIAIAFAQVENLL